MPGAQWSMRTSPLAVRCSTPPCACSTECLPPADLAQACLEVQFAETARAAHCPEVRLTAHVRACRQIDLQIDRLAATQGRIPLPPFGRPDLQPTGGELDTSLLSSSYIALLGWIGRTDLNDRVGTVAGHDPDVTDAEFQRY